jgi:lipid-A-disaccharide synthase
MEREVVKELIQSEMNASRLKAELKLILKDQQTINRMRSDFVELRRKLGGPGASANTAAHIFRALIT